MLPFYPYKRFKHYDWKCSYEALRGLELKQPLVLDVGCGDGRKTIIHKDLTGALIGLDIDLNALERAKTRGILVVRGDAKKLPFLSNSFEVALSLHVIEHITDDLVFIKEVHRILKSPGYAILITPNRTRLTSIVSAVYRLVTRTKKRYPMNPEHVFEYTQKYLKILLSASHFKRFKIISIGLIRLLGLEVATVSRLLKKYCDQLMVIAQKG